MLKPLTLSLSLAVALGFCSVSMAGIHDGCSTCGLASPQGGPIASARDRSQPLARPVARPSAAFSGQRRFSGLHCERLKCRVSSPSLLRVGPEEEAAVGTPRRWLRRRWLRDLRCCSGLSDWSGCSLGPGRLCRSLGPGWLCRSSGRARLWRWPAHVPGCEACRDHRLGSCRDDSVHRG